MERVRYQINVNGGSHDGKSFNYTFSRGSVTINVSASGYTIIHERPGIMDADKEWTSTLVNDAMRKCLLLQLIYFNENPEFEVGEVCINGEVSFTTHRPLILNLLKGKVSGDLSHLQNDNLVAHILNVTKTKFESSIASLYAYIFAKGKENEEERFSYYWRSFNGIYETLTEDVYWADNEAKKLNFWMQHSHNGRKSVGYYYRGDHTDADYTEYIKRKEREFFHKIQDRVAQTAWTKAEVQNALKARDKNQELNNVLDLSDFTDGYGRRMVTEINDNPVEMDLTLYGYLITEFCYLCRCIFFHANKPILLYCTEEDVNYKSLKLANILIEDLLDHTVVKVVCDKMDKING